MPDEIPVPNEQCCSLPPFTSDYSPVGEFVKLGVEGKEELEVYITGPKDARAALICIYSLPRPPPPSYSTSNDKSQIFSASITTLFRVPTISQPNAATRLGCRTSSVEKGGRPTTFPRRRAVRRCRLICRALGLGISLPQISKLQWSILSRMGGLLLE
jgi:hypothetical protein